MYRTLCLLMVCTLSFLVGCEENTLGPKPSNPSNPSDPSKVSGKSDSPTDATPAIATPFFPIKDPVHKIPPKPFKNHWSTLKPGAAKKAKLNAFFSRNARRINLDKLMRSIPYLFGVTWKHRNGQNMFTRLKLTLGGADYISLGKNNDDMTKLFMKLMDDMATNVCKQAIPADYKRATNARKFVRFENDVNANLRFIRLKFHAVYVPKTSTQGIAKLRVLYDKVLAKTKSKSKAWELICIATLTSPEFYAY